MKILIADDEKSYAELLADRLIQGGNVVECAHDGRSALELIKKNKYDIMIFDHNMPDLTGLELVKYIKDNNISGKTIMITGYSEIDVALMKAIGVDEYITKPVKIVDIDKIIKKYSKAGEV